MFMAGGMTYSEIREAYQLSSALNKDIIIGEFVWCQHENQSEVVFRFDAYDNSSSVRRRLEGP